MRKFLSFSLFICFIPFLTAQNHTVIVKGDQLCSTTQSYSIEHGAHLTLQAQPDSGYVFKQWSDGNTDNPRVVTVDADVTYVATYTELPDDEPSDSDMVSCTIYAGQCATPFSQQFQKGTELEIHAVPSECSSFIKWSDGNTENPRTIILTTNITLKAEFSPAQYTVKVESADESQGTVSVELVSIVGDEKNRIYYTSSDGNIVTPYSATVFGANIVSNTYQDGQGVIIFDRPVVSIGEDAFRGCSSLASITIPNSVTSIGERAFEECHSLTSVTIPNSVTSIGVEAFYRCKSLASIVIPNGVTSIGKSTFIECHSLTSVTIPNSVTSIGESAFEECHSLTSITIPNSVTSIGVFAFQGCKSLTSITIPNSVKSIGKYAFYNCESLTSVTIPNSVTSIGDWAFEYCSSLTSITFERSTPPVFGKDMFANTNNFSIYVPCGTKDAYVAALNVNNTIDASRVIEK